MEGNKIDLIFRNINNEDITIPFDEHCNADISAVKLKLCQALQMKNVCSDSDDVAIKRMKLFFKGRPLKDEELLGELQVSNKDVILYMITTPSFVSSSAGNDQQTDSSERPCNNNDNNNSVIDTSLIVENAHNNNTNENANTIITINRGFNRFLLYGVSPSEIAMIRLFFHSSMYQRSIHHNIQLDWSRESILEREESWLRSQSSNMRSSHHRNNSPVLRMVRHHSRFNDTNTSFLKGLLLGFLLNIFGIIFILLIRNLSPTFKCGFQLGIITSIFCGLIPYLLSIL